MAGGGVFLAETDAGAAAMLLRARTIARTTAKDLLKIELFIVYLLGLVHIILGCFITYLL
jgi:hypothetical protein